MGKRKAGGRLMGGGDLATKRHVAYELQAMEKSVVNAVDEEFEGIRAASKFSDRKRMEMARELEALQGRVLRLEQAWWERLRQWVIRVITRKEAAA